jgi:hypothetical protein
VRDLFRASVYLSYGYDIIGIELYELKGLNELNDLFGYTSSKDMNCKIRTRRYGQDEKCDLYDLYDLFKLYDVHEPVGPVTVGNGTSGRTVWQPSPRLPEDFH